MAITEHPNLERVVLAFRGDVDGAYKGSHAQYFTIMRRDDGSEAGRQLGRATTLAEITAAGFTFPEVVAGINMGTLLTCEQQATEIEQLQAQLAEASQQVAGAVAAREEALAQVASLQLKLQDYESPADVNGVPAWVYASQAHAYLVMAGAFDELMQMMEVEAAKPGADGMAGRVMLVWFNKSARFYRQNTNILGLIDRGVLTAAQVDGWFNGAAQIPVV